MRYLIDETKGYQEKLGLKIAADIGLKIKYDKHVHLHPRFIASIKNGTKKHTMKFHQEDRKDVIRLPVTKNLPLSEETVTKRGKMTYTNSTCVGNVIFDYIDVKQWKDVTEKDAKYDGFTDKLDFAVQTIHLAEKRGFILRPESYVSFYHIEDVEWR